MKSISRTFLYVFLLVLIMALGFFLGTRYSIDRDGNGVLSFNFGKNNKINKVLNLIKDSYVDSVNVDSMENLAINEIFKTLDPHSVYLPPTKAKEQNESLEGNFEGVGIEYYLLEDTLFVSQVIEGGPAEKAGLQKGDKVLAINKENLTGKGALSASLVNKLKGEKGSEVTVLVMREGESRLKTIEITRDKIEVSSIDAAFLMDKNNAYIKISRFGANTSEDFIEALTKLKDKGMRGLILDLRGNGGGYLNAATSIADQFLEDGKLIVYTKGQHEPRTDYTATSDGLFEKGNLVILIDENTASASEVVSGAMQDLDRAFIVGRRSFGKGLVQEQFGFDDGSAMNLTVARYYTPSGRSIQKSYENGIAAYKDELNKRFLRGEFSVLDSAKNDSIFNSTHTYKTAKGRVVYGGGGIMPDFFIPIDTSFYSTLYQNVNRGNLVAEFVYKNIHHFFKNDMFKDAEDFNLHFQVNDSIAKNFKGYLENKAIKVNDLDAKKSMPKLKQEMKALLGRFYFRDEGFYEVVNTYDPAVKKAQSLLSPSN